MSNGRQRRFTRSNLFARGGAAVRALIPMALVAVVLATWATAGTALAYVRTRSDGTQLPQFWNRTQITINALVGDPGPLLTPTQAGSAVRAAADAWNRSVDGNNNLCAGFQISVVQAPSSAFEVANDDIHVLQFRTDSWSRNTTDEDLVQAYDRSALAITSIFSRPATGQIVGTDVEINAVHYKWSDLVANPEHASQGAHDLQNTVTHEFGHVLGLDHTCGGSTSEAPPLDHRGNPVQSCASASAEAREATMFASVMGGDTERRTLAPDDMLGMCEIYPLGFDPDPSLNEGGPEGELVLGGCQAAGPSKPPISSAFLVALAFCWLWAWRRYGSPARARIGSSEIRSVPDSGSCGSDTAREAGR